MSRHHVELPLRATMEYLAGRIEQAEFEHWVRPSPIEREIGDPWQWRLDLLRGEI
jgi:hypothetical protein